MQGHRKLTTICCAAVLSLALAACGGGNGDDQTMVTPDPDPPAPPPPMVYPVTLPDGHGLNPGTTEIPAGTTTMLPSGTYITCAGAEDCTLTISIESVTGALSASSMGGMVSLSTEATRLAALHEMNQQTLTNARAALAELEAMDPGDVTANRLAMAQMAVTDALALPGNEDAPENQPTPPDPTPPPAPVANVTIPDAMYLDDDNAPAAATHMIPAGESATNNGVVFSCPADGDACEVEVMADGSVTSTGGVATAALSDDAMTQVAQAKKTEKDKADKVALENRDRIIGKDRALETVENLPLTGVGATEVGIMISRAAGAMASVRASGYTPHEDGSLPNGDWAGSRLMQTVTGTGTNHLIVYTDIEAPTRVQFYDFDGDDDTPHLYGDGTTANDAGLTLQSAGGTPQPEAATPSVGVSTATLDLTKFPAPGPAEDGNVTRNYRVNTDTTNDGSNDQVSIPGNFNGAGGRYNCDPGGGACSVTVTPGGAYTLVGTWTFVPELNTTAWRQDGEFMSFGWWMQEPTAETGTYTFQYYANGNDYTPPTAALATGSAIYNGRAAGKYVVQEIDDTGVTGGIAGQFVAAASLTARFSGTAADGSIEGTISGFQGEHPEVSGWSVTLNRINITGTTSGTPTAVNSTNQADPTAPGFNGATATMGDETAHGNWTSQFFGQPAGGSNAYPLGVGGTFQADNDAASIAGAFGARR